MTRRAHRGGDHRQGGGGRAVPECSGRVMQELEGVSSRETNPFSISAEDLREITEEIIPYWQGGTVEDKARSRWSEEFNNGVNAIVGGMIFTEVVGMGHILLNHARVVKKGLNGVIGEIEEKLASMPEEDGESRLFLEASAMACRAAIAFAGRYAEEAERLEVSEEDERRKGGLAEMAHVCRKVSARPAETLRGAAVHLLHAHLRSDRGLRHVHLLGRYRSLTLSPLRGGHRGGKAHP
ncbi:MAG: pyruvate formate lyase family protein [Actinomycetota bacterium]|nr:pyruvate formate lyase family protein [Actinomycetota bacterium]